MTAPYTLWREGGDPGAAFLVCAMFTASYRDRAARLEKSLAAFGLQHALFEVPRVHRSISSAGAEDMDLSKPRFIAHMLARFGKPVLYLDADMVVRQPPVLIAETCASPADFAVYNWLADPAPDAWIQIEGKLHLWRFGFTVDPQSQTQSYLSGATQFWRPGPAVLALLRDWEAALQRFPRAPDDHCLDYAFNRSTGITARWLPKSYMRVDFWPYEKPVVQHPGYPAPLSDHFDHFLARTLDEQIRTPDLVYPPFPRDGILDAERKLLLMMGPHGRYVPVGPLPRPLYLD